MSSNPRFMFNKIFYKFGVVFLTLFFAGCGGQMDILDENGERIEGAFITVEDDEYLVMAEGYESYEGPALDEFVLKAKPYHSVLGYVYDDEGPLEEAYVTYIDPNTFEPIGFLPIEDGYVYFPGILESNSNFLVFSEGYELDVVTLEIDGEEDEFMVEMEELDDDVVLSESPELSEEKLKEMLYDLTEMNIILERELNPVPLETLKKVQALFEDKGMDEMGFFGPITRSSVKVNPWAMGSKGSNADFFGTMTRSSYSSLAPVPPPPMSSSDTQSLSDAHRELDENLDLSGYSYVGAVVENGVVKFDPDEMDFFVRPSGDFDQEIYLDMAEGVFDQDMIALDAGSYDLEEGATVLIWVKEYDSSLQAVTNDLEIVSAGDIEEAIKEDGLAGDGEELNIIIGKSEDGDMELTPVLSEKGSGMEEVLEIHYDADWFSEAEDSVEESDDPLQDCIDVAETEEQTDLCLELYWEIDADWLGDMLDGCLDRADTADKVDICLELYGSGAVGDYYFMWGEPDGDEYFEDGAMDAYFYCLYGVNGMFPGILNACVAKYGNPDDPGNWDNVELIGDIGLCANEDPDFHAAADACAE
jgi:hypothetical protein